MEEQLAILRGLWDEPDGWSFEGAHYQVRDSLLRPKGRRPNLIIGGTGKPRSIRLAARYADEYNISSSSPAQVREIMARLDAACEAIGRDPATLARSVMAGTLVGRDEADMARADRRPRWPSSAAPATRPRPGSRSVATVGSWAPQMRARTRIAEYAESGVERLLLQDFLPRDLEHVALMAELAGL